MTMARWRWRQESMYAWTPGERVLGRRSRSVNLIPAPQRSDVAQRSACCTSHVSVPYSLQHFLRTVSTASPSLPPFPSLSLPLHPQPSLPTPHSPSNHLNPRGCNTLSLAHRTATSPPLCSANAPTIA